MTPPHVVDGAKILDWVWSGDVPFGHILNREGAKICAVHGLAICAYAGDPRIYRFSCDRNWNVEQDAFHDSAAEAKTEVAQLYPLSIAPWHTLE